MVDAAPRGSSARLAGRLDTGPAPAALSRTLWGKRRFPSGCCGTTFTHLDTALAARLGLPRASADYTPTADAYGHCWKKAGFARTAAGRWTNQMATSEVTGGGHE